ncbi:HEAT repeat domain-containing protein [Moorena sp. SIO3H5]|uniref:HEAT repeat domain-containing protein n=1 Tax=Moorena sp. SIO3H5 TaxID=2607834 RepID=UPI0013BE6ACE|nr:HEAT repeat domain-containing protein [Moorena sp. SIO3H5]NEO71434.1 NACHT domain-containing protein [Moorena sp. SIO3H5]
MAVLSLLASLELSKVASPLLGIIAGQAGKHIIQSLTKSDVEKAIKAGAEAVDQWDKQLDSQQRLFFHAPPDGWKGVNRFLNDYFTHSAVLAELQKPLLNQGKPDRDILSTVFQQEADAKTIKLNQDSLKPWIETFINAYFQQTDTYLKFQVAKGDYNQQLANWYDDVKFAGIAVPGQEVEKSEKLAQIFVMPDVVEDVSTAGAWERELLAAGSGEKAERALLEKTTGRKFLAEQLLTQSQSRRVVILGAPGSGKTTLMSYFAVMLAQQNPDILGLDGDTDWLPILIRMRDFARHLDKSLIDYARIFAENTMSVKPLPVGFFEHWLSDGRALILLDGLDEVAEEAKRHDVVRRIENFLGQFDRNRAIITSRPAGYRRDFFRTEEFPHYQIQPFDDQKISAFIDNWYNSRFQDQAEAERWKQSLRKALHDNDRITLLARNPLLLTIIALIHRYQAVLPKKRHKLYDKAVETLLINWDKLKDLSSDKRLKYLDFEDDLRRLMESLAYWIHTQGNIEDNDSGTLIDKNDLIDQLKQQIKDLKQVQPHQAEQEAKRFVELIRERTGLLNEQGQDCYGFVHKTFQEYLCAEEINYQADNERDSEIVLDPIREHLHDSHWREVLLLLIAQQKPKNAAKAIRAVLTNNSNYEQWLHRDLLFAGNCLAEDPKNLRGAESGLVQEILKRLVELKVSKDKRVVNKIRKQVYQIICSLSETDFQAPVLELLKERSDLIGEKQLLKYQVELGEKNQVIEIYQERLKDNDSDVRSSAALTLGRLGNSSETLLNALLPLFKYNDSDVRSSAAKVLDIFGNSSETVVNALLPLLKYNDSLVRMKASLALGILGNSSEIVVNALLPLLQDNNFGVREQTAAVLHDLGNSSEIVVNALRALLENDDYDVRITAAFALVNLGHSSETVVNLLQQLLQNPDPYERLRAAEVLGELGNSSEVVNALLPLLQDKSSSVRAKAAEVLGILENSSEVVNALLPLLQDNHSDVRITTIQSLRKLGNTSETVVSTLLALLEDNHFDVRMSAADVLGELGNSSEVVNSLLPLLQDNHFHMRITAAYALSALGNSSETAVNALLAQLDNPNSDVRAGVTLVLGMLIDSSETVVSALRGRLQDQNSIVRWRAADALVKLGNSSDTVVSTLLALLENNKSDVHMEAALTLVKLGNSSETVVSTLLAMLGNSKSNVHHRAVIALVKLGKTSNHILPTVIEWIEQHQDSDYVGGGIDALWDLVVGRE